MVNCSYCVREAIYFRPYSGENFCKKCYIKNIESSVQRIITTYKMFKPTDRIAVAVSGGKDSLSLLHILSRIERKYPKSELVTITIDEGISEYRPEGIDLVKKCCLKLGISSHVYSFKELYGYSLDEIVTLTEVKGGLSACSYCGILRRKALNMAAKDLGAGKLATAHNLDDEVQSMFMNFLRGDVYGITKIRPMLDVKNGFVQKVKPVCHLSDREVTLYAFLKRINYHSNPCPYLESSMRTDVRRFINSMEKKHPGIKYTVFHTFEKIQSRFIKRGSKKDLNKCEVCFEPTSMKTCRSCKIIQKIRLFEIFNKEIDLTT